MNDDELIDEWLYGPPGGGDEPESVGAMYARQEEEDRLKWIPGYRQTVLDYLRELTRWHLSWVRGQAYPPEPARVTELRGKISEAQRQRAVPPWEAQPERR